MSRRVRPTTTATCATASYARRSGSSRSAAWRASRCARPHARSGSRQAPATGTSPIARSCSQPSRTRASTRSRDKMRAAAAAHEGATALDAVRRFWDYSHAYLEFALEHPAHFRVMHAVPKSEHSRDIMLPRSPAVLAQAGMDALVEAGVVASETAGRALLACWTSVHGLASLAVDGQLPVTDELRSRPPSMPCCARRCSAPAPTLALPARAAAARRRLPRARRARARSRTPDVSSRAWRCSTTPDELLSTTRRRASGSISTARRARAPRRVPRARAAGSQRVQLGALALRRS